MTDDLGTPEFLEALADAIRGLNDWRDQVEKERLDARLGVGSELRSGGSGLPSMTLGASDPDRTLGNVEPFIGQTNLLADPTMENLEEVTPVATTENTYGDWRAKYVLNSGSAPTTRALTLWGERDVDENPFNSGVIELRVGGFASGNTTFYIYPANDFLGTQENVALPYLVAAVRIGDFGLSLNTLTNITTWTARIQILNAAGSVVAESPIRDVKQLIGDRPIQTQLVAALTLGGSDDDYRWRLRMDVAASGSGGTLRLKFGEPQLHYSYSPDPVPYSPQISRWTPTRVRTMSADIAADAAFIASKYSGETDDELFQISIAGTLRWGDGIGGGFDAWIKRSPEGGVQIGDDVAGGVIDRYDGNNVFNTYVPAVSGGGSVSWSFQSGWWQRIGKMIFVNITLIADGDGSGSDAVTVDLPEDPDRSHRQVLAATRTGAAPGGSFTGQIANAGSGPQIDFIRSSVNGTLIGSDLTNGETIAIQGWYRAAA